MILHRAMAIFGGSTTISGVRILTFCLYIYFQTYVFFSPGLLSLDVQTLPTRTCERHKLKLCEVSSFPIFFCIWMAWEAFWSSGVSDFMFECIIFHLATEVCLVWLHILVYNIFRACIFSVIILFYIICYTPCLYILAEKITAD